MNILIISTNRHRKPIPAMPTGACIVADAAERNGHTVRVLDLMFSRSPINDIGRLLLTYHFDIIGVSIRNIDNNDFGSPVDLCSEVKDYTTCIRKRTDAPVVIGGAACGVMPEALLRLTGADYAVLGDGEAVFPDLLENLEQSGGATSVPGVAWIEGDTFKYNPGHDQHHLSGACAPNYQSWINVQAYRGLLCAAGVQTKRGCPFSCVYCTYVLAEGKEYRCYDTEEVVDGIERLVRSGMPNIEFVDSIFNAPHEHAVDVCEALIPSHARARLQTLEITPRFVDDELLTAMENAGFVGIGITAESAADSVLQQLSKGFSGEDVRRAAAVIGRHKTPCLWMFLLGGPGETRETVRETLDLAQKAIRRSDVVFFNVGIRIYPGTQLEQIARMQGVLSVSESDMLSPVFYFTPQLSYEWLLSELEIFTAKNWNALGPHSINLPYLPRLYRIGARLGLHPPLWKRTPQARRALHWSGFKT